MDIYHLRYFVAVAENLNFTRAAEALCMTTSPLSRRIRDLERHVGGQLFERSSHDVTLTSAGRKFLPLARDILERFDDLPRALREGRPREVLLGVATSTPRDLVDAAAGALEARFTDTEVGVRCDTYRSLQQHLHEGQVDVAFQFGPAPCAPEVVGIPVREWRMGITMRTTDPRFLDRDLGIGDLVAERFVYVDDRADRSIRPSALHSVLESNGLRRADPVPDVIRMAYEIAVHGSFSLGPLEDSPMAKVLGAFGIKTRAVQGLDVLLYTWITWNPLREAHEPFIKDVGAALREELCLPAFRYART